MDGTSINPCNEYDESKKQRLFILLTFTGTVPGKLIKAYTKEPYSHVSIAFDKNLNDLYSFARRGLYNPFNSGFIKENIRTGIYQTGNFDTRFYVEVS